MAKRHASVIWLDSVGRSDVGRVGGKNALLGEMIRRLKRRGIAVPHGFATTADAYCLFIKDSGLEESIVQGVPHIARLIEINANRKRAAKNPKL